MSDKIELPVQQQPAAEEKKVDPLQAIYERLEALEKKYQGRRNIQEDQNPKLLEIQKKLDALEKEDIETVDAVFDDAIRSEQSDQEILKSYQTREQKIEFLEKEIQNSMYTIKRMLAEENYPRKLFLSNNNSENVENIRRMCFHVNRMEPSEFIKKYKEYIINGYNSIG